MRVENKRADLHHVVIADGPKRGVQEANGSYSPKRLPKDSARQNLK